MTNKQLASLRRILDRETAAYRALSGRPAPGQHPSEDKFAISDGNICILLNELLPNFPMGERVDSLNQIVQKERRGETHFPVPENQIDRSRWARQIRRGDNRPHGILLSAPITCPNQLHFDDAGAAKAPTEVVGRFDLQLLVDATDAIGGSPLFFLGFGSFNGHFPSLLAMPPGWTESNCAKPIALVLPMRI